MKKANQEYKNQFPGVPQGWGTHLDGYLAGFKRRGELDIEEALKVRYREREPHSGAWLEQDRAAAAAIRKLDE